MKNKIRKYEIAGKFELDINRQKPWLPIPDYVDRFRKWVSATDPFASNDNLKKYILSQSKVASPLLLSNPSSFFEHQSASSGNQAVSAGIAALTDLLTDELSNKMFDDSELGRGMATLFSTGLSSIGNTMADNVLKGTTLMEGVKQNAKSSLAGAGAGLAANWIGKGITSAMGDSRLGRAVGQGFSVGAGTLGGTLASNGKLVFQGSSPFSKVNPGAINPYALGANILGSALGAATGPSKEYGGTYGNITRTMDSVYDAILAGVNFIPGVGQAISGMMALNKGLSNIFGSTSGMTKTDAIMGSAFMPASIKWLNMAGAKTTGNFYNLSWLNVEKTNSFMGNAFGDLGDKFDLARNEANKTYGTFSQGARRRAQNNIDFANDAFTKVLAMADLNELQNIRSQAMSSINNQRYAQNIQGGFRPLAIGKEGMKIVNNAIDHNVGLRLLSGAALIDNKQMILSALNGTKVRPRPLPRKPATRDAVGGSTAATLYNTNK